MSQQCPLFSFKYICAGLASAAPRDNWGGCVVETPSRRRRRRCVLLACCCAVLTQALNCVRTSHSSRPCQQPSFSEMAARSGPRTRCSPVMTKRNLSKARASSVVAGRQRPAATHKQSKIFRQGSVDRAASGTELHIPVVQPPPLSPKYQARQAWSRRTPFSGRRIAGQLAR